MDVGTICVIHNHLDENNGKCVELEELLGDNPVITFNRKSIISLRKKVWRINRIIKCKVNQNVSSSGFVHINYIAEEFLFPIGQNNDVTVSEHHDRQESHR